MSRLHREIMKVLIAEIVSGARPTGDTLPSELELVAQFEMSRGVIRECIRGLEERGLVKVKHGMGAMVQPADQWDVFDADVVSALLHSDREATMLSEYLECRRILEIAGARLAAERATAANIEVLESAFQKMTSYAHRAQTNPAAEDLYHEADISFHRAVIAAAHNGALARMAEPLHRSLIIRRPLARPEVRIARGLPEHRRILDAIIGRRPDDAAAAMSDHLGTIQGYLRDLEVSPPRRKTTLRHRPA